MPEDSAPKPDVDAIVSELRQGMDDPAPPCSTDPDTAAHRDLQASLRKATATASVLGRCEGSLRGKLCKKLAWVAQPIVEQLNLHHRAVIAALDHIRRPTDTDLEDLKTRLGKLEAGMEALKREHQS
jgi:hypothetical protein